MVKLRKPLTIEFVLNQFLKKLDEEEVKRTTGKSVSHFRKCGDSFDNVIYK
jgi:hypothetical protein|tara:strand:+ start:520 stop:672 length:153 start_codon:yes stop_codon:yes gene_type:complete